MPLEDDLAIGWHIAVCFQKAAQLASTPDDSPTTQGWAEAEQWKQAGQEALCDYFPNHARNEGWLRGACIRACKTRLNPKGNLIEEEQSPPKGTRRVELDDATQQVMLHLFEVEHFSERTQTSLVMDCCEAYLRRLHEFRSSFKPEHFGRPASVFFDWYQKLKPNEQSATAERRPPLLRFFFKDRVTHAVRQVLTSAGLKEHKGKAATPGDPVGKKGSFEPQETPLESFDHLASHESVVNRLVEIESCKRRQLIRGRLIELLPKVFAPKSGSSTGEAKLSELRRLRALVGHYLIGLHVADEACPFENRLRDSFNLTDLWSWIAAIPSQDRSHDWGMEMARLGDRLAGLAAGRSALGKLIDLAYGQPLKRLETLWRERRIAELTALAKQFDRQNIRQIVCGASDRAGAAERWWQGYERVYGRLTVDDLDAFLLSDRQQKRWDEIKPDDKLDVVFLIHKTEAPQFGDNPMNPDDPNLDDDNTPGGSHFTDEQIRRILDDESEVTELEFAHWDSCPICQTRVLAMQRWLNEMDELLQPTQMMHELENAFEFESLIVPTEVRFAGLIQKVSVFLEQEVNGITQWVEKALDGLKVEMTPRRIAPAGVVLGGCPEPHEAAAAEAKSKLFQLPVVRFDDGPNGLFLELNVSQSEFNDKAVDVDFRLGYGCDPATTPVIGADVVIQCGDVHRRLRTNSVGRTFAAGTPTIVDVELLIFSGPQFPARRLILSSLNLESLLQECRRD
ncbi:MAG: hypothetical protein ACKV2Q_14710 [Planctomycetaceae bacterium]